MVTISKLLITISNQVAWTHIQTQVSAITLFIIDMSFGPYIVAGTYLGSEKDHKTVNGT